MNPLVQEFTQTATIIAMICSLIIPAVSALLKREHWDTIWGGVFSLALSFAAGFLGEWQASPNHFDWRTALISTVVNFGVAFLLGHKGVLQGTNTEAKLLAFPTRTAPAAPPPAQHAA